MLDQPALTEWRQSDPLWGPAALPFNVALQVVVAIAYVYASISSQTFEKELRWRIAFFIVLDFVAVASVGKSYWLLPSIQVLLFWLAVRESEAKRQNEGIENGKVGLPAV